MRITRAFLVLCAPIILAGCPRRSFVSGTVADPTSSPVSAGLFRDVTDSAGIRFRHTNGDAGWLYYPETFGGGCAFLDYDGDGYPDILLSSSGSLTDQTVRSRPNLALYHNNGHGGFVDVTAGSGLDKPLGYVQAVAIGDYDNDGRPDVFVAAYGGCHLFHNDGVRTNRQPAFTDVTERAGLSDTETGPRWASGAAWGDYDNDGRLDLIVIHYAVWSPAANKTCPRRDGSRGYCTPVVYDGDGVRLFHNDGGGRFHDVTAAAGLAHVRGRGLAVAWLDADDDGREDIYIANDLDPNYLLHNNGNGTFREQAVDAGVAFGSGGKAASGMGIALADYDHSGRESIFVTNILGEQYSLFHSEGPGTYNLQTDAARLSNPTTLHTGWGTAFIDIDRDGWPDIVTANSAVHPFVADDSPSASYQEPKGVFRNLGTGSFEDITAQSGAMSVPRPARGLAIADYDRDGRMDVLCLNRDERADLFHNESPDTNHWISLLLVGVKSNRDAAGAKVRLTVGGKPGQLAEVRLSSSYASSSDKRLHFGLGQASRVDAVDIRWPSGIRETLRNLPGDSFLTVTEGKGYRREGTGR